MGGSLSTLRPGYDYSYEIEDSLGQGGFGEVSLVRKNGQCYAMKKLDLPNVADVVGVALNNQEIRILRTLNHPNVVAYVDSFYEIAGDHKGIYIVMEYCEKGSLRDLMWNEGRTGRLSNPLFIINLTMQICMGLTYIHSRGLIHRDIKPENIFIDSSGNAKIGDFGLCKVLEYNQMANTYVGTRRYMAPEVGMFGYSYLCDMFSTGVVFFELWSRVPPVLPEPYFAMESLIIQLQSTVPSCRPTATATLDELFSIQNMITNANQVVPPQIPALPLEILHLLRPENV